MLAFSDDHRPQLQRLAEDFRAIRGEFFSAADLAGGQFTCPDPSGEHRTCSLTSVRVVYLERPLQHMANPRELHELAHSLRLAATCDFGDIVFERRGGALARRDSA